MECQKCKSNNIIISEIEKIGQNEKKVLVKCKVCGYEKEDLLQEEQKNK